MMKPPGHVQAVIDWFNTHNYAVHVRHMRTGSLCYTLSGGREMNAHQLITHFDKIQKRHAVNHAPNQNP